MFVAEAIADFSPSIINGNHSKNDDQQNEAEKQIQQQELNEKQKIDSKQNQIQEKQLPSTKRQRQKQHEQELDKLEQQQQDQKPQQEQDQDQENAQPKQQQVSYISFKTGNKILVRQTDQSGWWYGNVIGNQSEKGFFPSTYVKCGSKAPKPQMPTEQTNDWMTDELNKMHEGPVQSQYYQGIIGHKLVKIDDKNKNILKGNYVKYNEATGLASVPIKSQAPNAKAVRQMGYYFDYHQWIDERNNLPQMKARPDVRRKKKKKLNLILFGEDRERANQKKK